MKRSLAVITLLAASSSVCFSQAKTAASRAGDLQVGGGFTVAKGDYVPEKIKGFSAYADFDFLEHWGAEVDFHQLNDPDQVQQTYERSYEFGGRYLRRYGRFTPYARLMYGRGVFNFPKNVANLAYNMADIAIGTDIKVHPRINVRVEYEYQDWFSAPGLTNGLTPQMITIGAAYHFPGGNARK